MWTRLIMSALLIIRWYPRFVISGYLVIPGSMTECVMVVSATGGYWGKELTTPDMLTNNWTCSLLVNLRYAEDLSGNCSSSRAYYWWWDNHQGWFFFSRLTWTVDKFLPRFVRPLFTKLVKIRKLARGRQCAVRKSEVENTKSTFD